MMTLLVHIERNGSFVLVGKITGNTAADAQFRYAPEYLHEPEAAPISISLPLQDEALSAFQTAAFFEGLLPESFTRRAVAQWMQVDEGDYLSILHGLGRECLGALCVTEEHEVPPHAAYEPVSEQQVQSLAAEGAVRGAELVTKSHLSLTGASGKAGLYYAAKEHAWYLPKGTAPSTHIVKQSHVRLDSIVVNEQLSMQTAARCGIAIPHSIIINTGSGAEREVLFATERYDRIIPANAEKIDGLPKPYRLHQEDFAQAMGIPASAKYERTPDTYLKQMFHLLRIRSSDPISDQLRLWDILVYDFLLGNTDAHIKNFSLLYGANLKSVRLAPAYDLVSTAIYEQSTRDMAFQIGGVSSLDKLAAEDFRRAAGEIGLGEKVAMKHFDLLCGKFEAAIRDTAHMLRAEGYPDAQGIAERILKSGGFYHL